MSDEDLGSYEEGCPDCGNDSVETYPDGLQCTTCGWRE